ncbi:hypothetical protein BU16DRAFT_614719 [Lophium mytilinum]|uniref:Heterokaryon incompatibility domain-containing protein n=1 Tax=Lophium mytilinum TaxID=390894 RepID=A0A6A6R3C0_9PEZI|nr:hypothetical protein BU16DRAFT_614719 [Lophium mytilinum]
MEHLPVKGGRAPIAVPYVPGPRFDGGDFASYPQRMGWDFSLWFTYDAFLDSGDLENWLLFNQKDLDELTAFLQAWLFFGLLATVINAEVPLEDFVRRDFDGGRYITTAELTQYLNEWDRLIQANASPVIDKTAHLAELSSVLKDAATINRSLSKLITAHGLLPSPYAEQLQGIHFCAALLLRALSIALEHVLGRRPGVLKSGQPGRLPLLEERMHQAGWCPFTTFQLSNNFPEDTQAYAFALGTIRIEQDHEGCTFQSCTASQYLPGTPLRHTREGCECEVIEAPVEQIVNGLKRGRIPLLQIASENGRPFIDIYKDDGVTDIPYIAISHVWADGLGTSTSNCIATCQAMKLAESMKLISNESVLPFWLDTLCIPTQPQHQTLRVFSVQKMHKIYSSSHGVLILDADLECLPSNASYAEIMTRFSISAWNTRLWTYHEGTLAPRHYVRGRDTVFDFESLQQRVVEGDSHDSIAHSLNLFAAASFSVLFRGLGDTRTSKSDLEIQNLLATASKRTASRPEDETICIAIYLGLDVAPLLKTPPSRRVETLLSSLPAIPANILWGSGPRLVTKGFRWAPASFLQPYGMIPMPVPDLVPASAANLHTEMVPRPLSYLHPTGKGLMAYLPAISISNLDFSMQRFLVDVGEGEVYRLGFFLRDGGRIQGQGRPKSVSFAKRSFVVLLALFFHDEYPGFDVKQKGILAEVVGKTKDPAVKNKRFSFKQVTQLEYRETMFVERTSRSGDFGGGDEGKAWISGEHVEPKWWLID